MTQLFQIADLTGYDLGEDAAAARDRLRKVDEQVSNDNEIERSIHATSCKRCKDRKTLCSGDPGRPCQECTKSKTKCTLSASKLLR